MEFLLNISLILPAEEMVIPVHAIEAVGKLKEFFKLRGISIHLSAGSRGEEFPDGQTVRLEYHNADTLVYDVLLEADTRCIYKFSDIIFVGNSSIFIEGEKVVALEEVKYFQANGLLGSYRRKLAAVVPEDEESDQVIALRKQLFQLELLFFNYDLFVRSLRNGSNPIKDTAVSDKILAVYHNIFNTGADFSMPRVLEQMTDVTDDAGTHSNIEEFLMILKLYSEFLIIAEDFGKGREILEKYHKIYDECNIPKSFQLQHQKVVCQYFLASVLLALKEFDKGIDAFQYTVDSAVLLLGEYHPDILFYLHLFTSVYDVEARYSDSARIQEQLTSKIEHIYGCDSSQYAISVNNMAYCCYKDGNYDRALELYLETVDILEALQEERGALFCTIYGNISNCLWEKEQFEDAMDYAIKSYSLSEQIFGEDSIEAAESYKLLGKCHYALGEMEDALKMYKKALPILLRNYGCKERSVLVVYSDMASCYLNVSNYEEAEKCLLRLLEIQKEIYGEEHVETATTYHKLGFLYSDTGKMDEAIEQYKKTLEIRRKTLRKYHPDISNILANIGRFYAQQDDWDKAFEHFKESLDIVKRNFGPMHSKTRAMCMETVDACFGTGKFIPVIELLEKFLRGCSRVSDMSNDELADVAWFHHALGLAYENVEDFKKALSSYIKAFTIRKKLFGEEHPDTVSSYEAFVMVQSVFVPYSGKLQ